MSTLPEAIDSLRAALRKKSVESPVQDALNYLVSHLVLLNSSSPSVQMIRKLSTVLRQQFLPLYNACLQPALQLSCVVLSTVLTKLCDACRVEGEDLHAAWDATANSMLYGILDFLDQADCDVESDIAVWQALCRLICEFFFYDSGRGQSEYSIQLRLSAYNTLTETAARQVTVRNALRNKAVLGGERLGAAISRTRDYLVLEALLTLFCRLLPPIHNTSQGKLQRAKFVREVLGSPKLFKCNAELLGIMERTSETHWDDVAAQIIDVLARSDITYPQPFPVDDIDVCGRVFPQPLATDRLIMDRQAFLANIVVENDDPCDSLQIPYSHIRTITLDNSDQNVHKGKVVIIVYLTSPPLVADIQMKSSGRSHHAKFFLGNDAVSRFMEALRRRGVGKLSFLNPLARSTQRKRKNISIGSGFMFTNNSSPTPPTASFEGKVQHVNQVYKTKLEESTMSEIPPVTHVEDTISSAISDPKDDNDITLVPGISGATIAGDVTTIHTSRMFPPTGETSKSIQDFTFSLPGNPTTFDDYDEISDISEIGPEEGTVNVQVSTSCDQRTDQKIDCMRMNGSSDVTPYVEAMKSSVSASNSGNCTPGGVAQRLAGTKNPHPPHSPIFGSSSSTQINVSPNPFASAGGLLIPVRSEVVGGMPVTSRSFARTDDQKKIGVDECGLADTILSIPAAETPQTGLSSAGDQLEHHSRHVTASSGPQIFPRTKNTENTNTGNTNTGVPPKIAGSRRKRETTKSSGKITIDVDDESTPRKKRRNGRHGIMEHKTQPEKTSPHVISVSRVKRSTKTIKDSCGGDPTEVDVGESSELMPSCRGTRKSSRIKKRQWAEPGETGINTIRAKSRKGKHADGAPSIPSSHASSVSPLLKNNGHVSTVETGSPEITTTEMNIPQEILKGDGTLSCQLSLTLAEEPQGSPDFAQQAASNTMQLVENQFFIETEEAIDVGHVTSDPRTVDNDVNRIQGVINHSTSLKEGIVEQPPLNLESPPRKRVTTIDLTMDNSPTQENELQEAPFEPVCSEANSRPTFTTPDKPDCTAVEAAVVSSPRHRRRSVTFASPIEYMLDNRGKSDTHVSSTKSVVPSRNEQPTLLPHIGTPQSRRSPSPSESNTLSPLRIPTGSVSLRRSQPDRITPRVILPKLKPLQTDINGLAHDRIANEDEIQDIVEVLNEIQAVIIKGISDKFKNAKKSVQRGREELIQLVLDELHGMAVENAKYFNELLRLEEDYHENGKSITCCWEELIDSNDGAAAQVRKVLEEHDQNISAKTFPKSLPLLKPAFLRRRASA